jgi:hypothetical protein
MSDAHSPFYIPTHFAGKRIKFRVPYTMPGELVVPNGTTGLDFPEATFLHTVELDFEIWSAKFAASQLDGNGVPIAEPAPGINKFWRVRIQDVSKNQLVTKNAQLVATLIDTNSGEWFWRVPYSIVRAEGFQVTIDNLLPAAPGNDLRAEVTFRGFLLVLEPPSETR